MKRKKIMNECLELLGLAAPEYFIVIQSVSQRFYGDQFKLFDPEFVKTHRIKNHLQKLVQIFEEKNLCRNIRGRLRISPSGRHELEEVFRCFVEEQISIEKNTPSYVLNKIIEFIQNRKQ